MAPIVPRSYLISALNNTTEGYYRWVYRKAPHCYSPLQVMRLYAAGRRW